MFSGTKNKFNYIDFLMGKPVTALDLIQISNHQIYLFKLATILQKKHQSKRK